MNEVVKVSIAGIGFDFDVEAYEVLRKYLDGLTDFYNTNPDGDEIISDIEARIVELVLSCQNLEQVVSQPVIEKIIGQMGVPDEMGQQRTGPAQSNERATERSNFPHRLYRNPDGALLGGVCNGLGTLLKIDPVWIRLGIFMPVVLIILLSSLGFNFMNGFLGSLFGSIVLVYFIMWIAVPLARTSRQKLEMSGEPVTARSIESRVAQEASAMPRESGRSAKVMADIFVFFGKLTMFIVKLIVLLIAISFALAAISLLIALFSVATATGIVGTALIDSFMGLQGISVAGYVIMVLLVVLIPLVILVYQMLRIIFNFRNSRSFMWILAGTWLLLVVYTGVITVRNSEVIATGARNIELLIDPEIDLEVNEGLIIINGDTLLGGEKRRIDRETRKKIKEALGSEEISLKVFGSGENIEIIINDHDDSEQRKIMSIDVNQSEDGDTE